MNIISSALAEAHEALKWQRIKAWKRRVRSNAHETFKATRPRSVPEHGKAMRRTDGSSTADVRDQLKLIYEAW